MTEKELILDIRRELTFARALPFSLPEEEIKFIITIASRYFYDNWQYAVQERYMIMPLELFNTPQFRKNRVIIMPECVQSVIGLKEMKNGSVFGTIDRDFSEQKFIGSEIFLTPFMGESIVYRLAVFSFLDLTRNLVLEDIAYGYNKNARTLFVKGHTPKTAAVCRIMQKLEPEFLYNDELFQRYCRAKAKVRLADMLQTFDFQMPGNIKLNIAAVVQSANKEMEDIQKQMSSETLPNFMLFDRF